MAVAEQNKIMEIPFAKYPSQPAKTTAMNTTKSARSQPLTLSSFPPEILENIFSHLCSHCQLEDKRDDEDIIPLSYKYGQEDTFTLGNPNIVALRALAYMPSRRISAAASRILYHQAHLSSSRALALFARTVSERSDLASQTQLLMLHGLPVQEIPDSIWREVAIPSLYRMGYRINGYEGHSNTISLRTKDDTLFLVAALLSQLRRLQTLELNIQNVDISLLRQDWLVSSHSILPIDSLPHIHVPHVHVLVPARRSPFPCSVWHPVNSIDYMTCSFGKSHNPLWFRIAELPLPIMLPSSINNKFGTSNHASTTTSTVPNSNAYIRGNHYDSTRNNGNITNGLRALRIRDRCTQIFSYLHYSFSPSQSNYSSNNSSPESFKNEAVIKYYTQEFWWRISRQICVHRSSLIYLDVSELGGQFERDGFLTSGDVWPGFSFPSLKTLVLPREARAWIADWDATQFWNVLRREGSDILPQLENLVFRSAGPGLDNGVAIIDEAERQKAMHELFLFEMMLFARIDGVIKAGRMKHLKTIKYGALPLQRYKITAKRERWMSAADLADDGVIICWERTV